MKRRAFTLIELLVVVSIIAILLAILIPSLGKARDRAKTVACAANVRNIYLGIANYAAEFNGMVFPQSLTAINGQKNSYWFGPVYLGAEWGKNSGLAQISSGNDGKNYMTQSYNELQKKFLHCPADPTSGDEYVDQQKAHGYTITDYSYNSQVQRTVNSYVQVYKLTDFPPNTLLITETHQGVNIKGNSDFFFKNIGSLFVYDGDQANHWGNSPLAGRIHKNGTSANMLFADGRIILGDPLKMNTTNGVVQATNQPNGTAGTDYRSLVEWSKYDATHPFPYP